jgi:hypothetical protein
MYGVGNLRYMHMLQVADHFDLWALCIQHFKQKLKKISPCSYFKCNLIHTNIISHHKKWSAAEALANVFALLAAGAHPVVQTYARLAVEALALVGRNNGNLKRLLDGLHLLRVRQAAVANDKRTSSDQSCRSARHHARWLDIDCKYAWKHHE